MERDCSWGLLKGAEEEEMGGVLFSWQASIWGGPSCVGGAGGPPGMSLLEAQVVPFLGAQERREPYPCQEALQAAPERWTPPCPLLP